MQFNAKDVFGSFAKRQKVALRGDRRGDGALPTTELKTSLLSGSRSKGRHRPASWREWLNIEDNSMWILLLILHSGFASILALVMDEAVVGLVAAHQAVAEMGESTIVSYFNYLWFRVLLVAIAVIITQQVSPIAAGSGIPEM
jgi:hypothetical protein